MEYPLALDVVFLDAQKLFRLAVDLHDVQVVVQQNDAVGACLDDLVAHAFGALAHVRNAHIDVRVAVGDRPCLFHAGIVPAGAAVEHVRLGELARLCQNFFELAVGGRKVLGALALVHAGEIDIFNGRRGSGCVLR